MEPIIRLDVHTQRVCVYIYIHLLNTYTILQVHMHTQDFRLVLRCHPGFLLLKPSCVMIASHFVGQISIKVIFCCTHIKPSFFANRKLERNNSIGWSRFIFFLETSASSWWSRDAGSQLATGMELADTGATGRLGAVAT